MSNKRRNDLTRRPCKPDERPEPRVVVNVFSAFPHGLHLCLTLLTCGLWLPVWIVHRMFSSR